MAYKKSNPNGQAVMASSEPVVIASNQSAVPVNTAQINAVTPLMGNGVTGTGSQRVTIASDNTTFAVTAAATLAAETTKVIGTINIAASQTVLANGDTAHDAVDAGNPVKVGVKAANAFPTAVANADRANTIGDLWGRQMITHIDPAQQIHKSFNATTTQTGIDVWSPTAGKKIAITSIVIGTYGTTAGRIILWFGDNADTTYTAGTDQLVLAFSSAPSATAKPGLVFTPAFPVFCTTADRELHITTDAAISIDIAVEGYEF